jgi:hypothetical protein
VAKSDANEGMHEAGHSDLQKFDFNVSVTVATLICHRIGLLTVFLFALVLTACGAPVKVERVNLRTAYEDLNRTAFSTDQPSEATRTVLRRAALLDTFDTQPDAAIVALRAEAIAASMHWPDPYALAEMNYAQARRARSKPMLLASALYAYAVLFPAGDVDKPSSYSAQFHHATNFYNLALTQVLSGESDEGTISLARGRYPPAASAAAAGGKVIHWIIPAHIYCLALARRSNRQPAQ